MRATKILLMTSCLALFLAPLVARADEWDKKTILTFDKPVEIPGRVLPAGQYVFKLADSQSDRHIVQVFNRDENHIYAPVLTIPEYRIKPTDKTVVDFEERATGAPEAVKDWFYPGRTTGEEFLYAKVRPVQLAEAAAPPAAPASHVVKPPETRPTPAPAKAPAPLAPAQQPMLMARAAPPTSPPAAQTSAAPAKAPMKHLPKTASPLLLMALLGIACFGAAASVRVIRRAA